jgi:uncharacterized protein
MTTPSASEPPTATDTEAGVVRTAGAIADISAADWDACANPDASHFDPFISHAFLAALEASGSVGEATGWVPCHLALEDAAGGVRAVAPTYLKTHSQGEYIFDHAWANAYTQAGGRYYPKLQIAVPFTPVPGRRLLVRKGEDEAQAMALLATGAAQLARQSRVSSVHITFCDQATQAVIGEQGYLARLGQQYHWFNDSYRTFDDFLATLSSRKRKTMRKEREQALASGMVIELLSGAEITEAHWDAFFRFYIDTGNRKWGRPYLNRAFFSELGQGMSERCLLIMVKRDGRYVAGALNLIGGDCLYGRYWGAVEHHPCLHFEVCYYQAIDFAIAHGLKRVEAGAQGEHKLARGYRPVKTYSAHWIGDPGFRRAVENFLKHERAAVVEEIEALDELTPYRRGDVSSD